MSCDCMLIFSLQAVVKPVNIASKLIDLSCLGLILYTLFILIGSLCALLFQNSMSFSVNSINADQLASD